MKTIKIDKWISHNLCEKQIEVVLPKEIEHLVKAFDKYQNERMAYENATRGLLYLLRDVLKSDDSALIGEVADILNKLRIPEAQRFYYKQAILENK